MPYPLIADLLCSLWKIRGLVRWRCAEAALIAPPAYSARLGRQGTAVGRGTAN